MLTIRLQRLGRKALPVYRLAVQEAHRHPSSGRVVAYVGSYNPHTKETALNKEKLMFYLKNGAQPTPRVVRVLVTEKLELPDWVKGDGQKNRQTRHPEKLRKNQPKQEEQEEVVAEAPQAPADDAAPDEATTSET